MAAKGPALLVLAAVIAVGLYLVSYMRTLPTLDADAHLGASFRGFLGTVEDETNMKADQAGMRVQENDLKKRLNDEFRKNMNQLTKLRQPCALPSLTQKTNKKRVLIISACFGVDFMSICPTAFQRMDNYSIANGYKFKGHYKALNTSMSRLAQKVLLMQNLLSVPSIRDNYDVIAWMDADIFVVNYEIRLENFYDLASTDVDLIFSVNPDGSGHISRIDSGIILARTSNISQKYFQRVAMVLQEPMVLRTTHLQYEQAVTLTLLQNFSRNALLLPPCCAICLWSSDVVMWRPGCFASHLNGLSDFMKLSAMHRLSLSTSRLSKQDGVMPGLNETANRKCPDH